MPRLILALGLALGFLLAACSNHAPPKPEPQFGLPSPAPKELPLGEAAKAARQSLFGAGQESDAALATIYKGTGNYVRMPKAAASIGTGGDVTLNFVEADIRDVAKAVLGDALKLNYTIDNAVQGKVTLQTATPITRAAVLPSLEVALRLAGVALIHQKGVYVLAPLADTQKRSMVPRLAGSDAHGYGLQIVQLRYVTVADMQKVLSALAPQGSIVHADNARNLLILCGTEQELGTLTETIALFDVDYLKSTSFGVFAPRHLQADDLAKGLEEVAGGADSPVAGMLKFVPIPRNNALLVIAKQPDLLGDVQLWVKRLDVENDGPSRRRVYLYRVQNAKAPDLADTLARLFGAANAQTAGDRSSASNSARRSKLSTAALTQTGGGLAAAAFGTSQSPAVQNGAAALEPTGSLNAGASGFEKDGLRVVADERNNLLMVLATPREYEDIEQALKQIDIAPDQVLIEATIAEVSLSDDLKFGVQWLFQPNKQNKASFSEDAAGKILSKFPGFSYSYLIPDTQIVLNALSNVTKVKVISSPKMMVLDNQTATLEVGDEVPITTQSAANVTNPDATIVSSIQYRQTGVILEVTPRVNKSGLVTLDVSQEVSDVSTTTSSTLNSPTIQQRKFSSTVAVETGSTVALGGLIRDNVSRGKDGVPLLKDIPVLGAAFRSTNNNERRTELLVFMTPRIIRSTDEARQMTDYLRDQLKDANQVLAPRRRHWP